MISIRDINKTKGLTSASKAKKSSGGESFSSYLGAAMGKGSEAVSQSSNISVANAIFATQMVDSDEEKEIAKHLIKRGNSLLEKMEEIRDGLLIGEISKDKLIEISRFVKDRRFETQDERLKDIIDEIELRIEVELAKLMK